MTVIEWCLKHGSLNGIMMFTTIKVNKFGFMKIIFLYKYEIRYGPWVQLRLYICNTVYMGLYITEYNNYACGLHFVVFD